MFSRIAALLIVTLLPIFPQAQEIFLSIWSDVKRYDPVYATRSEEIILSASLFESLTDIDRDANIVPAQAESWEISPDGLVYTFKLREGIRWSDGEPVTAKDFVLSFQRNVDPSLDEDVRPTYLMNNILNAEAIVAGKMPPSALGVEALDDRTFRITLNAPAAYFLSILAYPSLAPAPSHMIERFGDDWWRQTPLVSNGQFRLEGVEGNAKVLKRNDLHWDPIGIETVFLRNYPNKDDSLRDWLRGELDVSFDIDLKQRDWLRARSPARVTDVAIMGTVYGIFNTRRAHLADVRVRKALDYLVDRHELARAVDLSAESVASSFTPTVLLDLPGDVEPEWMNWSRERRLAEANALLAEAGYSEENRLSVSVMTSDMLDTDRLGTLIRSMWTSSPLVDAGLTLASRADFAALLRARDFDFCIVFWLADYSDPATFLGLLTPGGGKNHSGWTDDEYLALLEKSLRTPERSARYKLYIQMERIVQEQHPILPINHPVQTNATSEKIKDFYLRGNWILPRTVTLQ